VWEHIQRVRGELAIFYKNFTHICRHCKEGVKCYKSKKGDNGSWQTTKALDHLRYCSKYKETDERIHALDASNKKMKAKKEFKQAVLMVAGGSNRDVPIVCDFFVSQKDAALASQARYDGKEVDFPFDLWWAVDM
jgi:hypothetical protein